MKTTLSILLLSLCFSMSAQDLQSSAFKTFSETAQLAKTSKKNIIMVFTNSKESEEVVSSFMSNPEFTTALSKYIIHVVDMSENNGLSNEEKMLNARLDIHHNKNKTYPSIYVVDYLGSSLTEPLLDFSAQNNMKFSSTLKTLK